MIIRDENAVQLGSTEELPKMDGTASSGTSSTVARADHVHPTDTTRAAASHTHSPSNITTDSNNRFVTDTEKSTWNSKAEGNHSHSWNYITGKPTTFAPSSHTHTKSQITDFPTKLPASDVYSWAKASSKPSYSWNEITGKPSSFTPAAHNQVATTITQDSTHRFVTDSDKTVLNTRVNPNMLDNCYFANPVNQRGYTAYSNLPGHTYTIDRWYTTEAPGTSVNLQTFPYEAIEITTTAGHGGIQWVSEGNLGVKAGYTYCVSVYVKKPSQYAKLDIFFKRNATIPIVYTSISLANANVYSATITVPSDYVPVVSDYWELTLHCESSSTTTFSVKSIKMERGTTSTLLSDMAPNFQLEMFKCMRYFVSTGGWQYWAAGFITTRDARFSIPVPTYMRVYPSIRVTNYGYLLTPTQGMIKLDSGNINFTVENCTNNAVKVMIYTTFDVPVGTHTLLDTDFELSSELFYG